MENGPIFEWSPGDLIVNVDGDAEAVHKEMNEVEYPDDDDYHNQDPDAGGIPIVTGATIITNDEELEDMDKDRSNNRDEYEGDWTNKLNEGDDQGESEEDHESRSNCEDSQLEKESDMGETDAQVDTESSAEEEPIENKNNTAVGQGNNMRPRRMNAGTGVTRLELSMKGKSHQDTRVQFMQKGTGKNEGEYKSFTKLKETSNCRHDEGIQTT